MGKRAVIVIDMLNDFVTGNLANPRAQRIIPPLQRLLSAARASDTPVIYCCDTHLPGLDHELNLWGNHALAGSEGARVIPELEPQKGDFTVPKRHYSAFFQTGLYSLLHDLKVDTLIITGMLSNICVRHTAADGYQWGFAIVVPEDGIEALDDVAQADSLADMKALYGAEITSCDELASQ